MLKQIRVLGSTTRIKVVSPKTLKDAWADYDPKRKEIRLANNNPPLQNQEALLHEIMHAIEEEYGFDMNHEHLTLMARGIRIVMRENPKLAKVIFGDTK